MPGHKRRQEIMDPPGKVLNPPLSLSPLIGLIFICLCKGLLSQNSEFKLTVPASVSVQEGLCVHIPCNFTYDAAERTRSRQLYGYWFQKKDGEGHYFPSGRRVQGVLVATNDNRQTFGQPVKDRFQLRGNPEEGDCSFSILNARLLDAGEYYFRIESGDLRYSYQPKPPKVPWMPQVFVTEITEKPQILNSSAVLAEKEAVFTCSAQGPCSKTKAVIYWATILSGYTISQWSQQLSNGSWTYWSNYTLTPSVNDQGESLTCRIWYPNMQKQVENTILLNVAYPSQIVEISTNATNHRHLAFCAPEGKDDAVSAVVQEGESISLVCKAQGRPDPTLSWRKWNRTLNGSKEGKEHTLLLLEVGPENAGEYQCHAENVHGSTSKTLRLCVLYPPRTVAISVYQTYKGGPALIQDTPMCVASGSQLTAQEGSSLRLLCTAQGYPPTNTSWVKGSRTLAHPSPSPENWLELTDLTVEDAGPYACQARNHLGSLQKTVQLSVAYAPRVSSNRSRSTCWKEADSLHCNCSLNSWPPPQIQWQVNGQTLRENSTQGALRVTSKPQKDKVTSSLSWATGNLEENQSIVCLGSNPLGTYTLHFLLIRPTNGSQASLIVSGLSGALVAIVLGVFCLCLIKFYKQKKAKATQKASGVMNSTNGVHQRPSDDSLIYSNITPLGRKPPHVDHSKAAPEKTSTAIPRVLSSRIAEPEELYYATLEFSKLKAKGFIAPEEDVEYTEVKKK